jgi:four helix bundle protein
MARIQSHRDLIAWQLAYSLGLTIYRASKHFPKDELYGLTSQIRRAVVSIASNIAEGYGRNSKQDYVRFLNMARGSLYEVDTQLSFAKDFQYMDHSTFEGIQGQLDEAGRVLTGLIRSLKTSA